jgi:hypothetical protein
MKPILFSTPMAQALLNTKPGVFPAEAIDPSRPCKSMTRRVVKPQPGSLPEGRYRYDGIQNGKAAVELLQNGKPTERYFECPKPRYEIGDILWVRETWHYTESDYVYRANFNDEEAASHKWASPIFMPRSVARLFIEVKGVRLERVQDITEEDAKAEGAKKYMWFRPFGAPDGESITYDVTLPCEPCYKNGYATLWEKLNAKRGYPWESNPWVWVYEFMRTA